MRSRAGRIGVLVVSWALVSRVSAGDDASYYRDPPPQRATHGIADCPAPVVPVMTPDQARREAHQRVERGTSCFLAGTCEAGGDYKDDAAINGRVAAALGAERRFAGTSLWVTTLRRFVTIQGCLVDETQGRAVERFVADLPGVKLVWQEARAVRAATR